MYDIHGGSKSYKFKLTCKHDIHGGFKTYMLKLLEKLVVYRHLQLALKALYNY